MSSRAEGFQAFARKMRAQGIEAARIDAFQRSYEQLVSGATGLIPESEIQPVETLPHYSELSQTNPESALIAQTAILKLNGGLGTSMGLDGPKSLLPIKGELTFLDFIVRQVLHARKKFGPSLQFLLMNSFSTAPATREFLRRYPEFGNSSDLELMQGSVPKVDAKTLEPADWPQDRELEWCPPGHGDLYPSIFASGWLARLLDAGVRYLFVSNSDNLGASLDPALLRYFADSGKSFVMEVAERTGADKKGGHLARRAGKFLLRESAQCPPGDMEQFQDITRHRFFNTNNLWIRLDVLKQVLEQNGGVVPLPVIKNSKTVDPKDPNSPAVVQLETAMGAAIELFPNTGAIVVPRSRFAPVKTTSDLLALRSDAYDVTSDWLLRLAAEATPSGPLVDLDSKHYKLMAQLDALVRVVPSLKRCRRLAVKGPVLFGKPVDIVGTVSIRNSSNSPAPLDRERLVDEELVLLD